MAFGTLYFSFTMERVMLRELQRKRPSKAREQRLRDLSVLAKQALELANTFERKQAGIQVPRVRKVRG